MTYSSFFEEFYTSSKLINTMRESQFPASDPILRGRFSIKLGGDLQTNNCLVSLYPHLLTISCEAIEEDSIIQLDLLACNFEMVYMNGNRYSYSIKISNNRETIELYAPSEETFNEWKAQISQYCVQDQFYSKYEIKGNIAEGGYGAVYLVEEMESKKLFAAKAIFKDELIRQAPSKRKMVFREIQTMISLSHPNIVRLFEIHESTDRIILIMEYVKEGNLYDVMVKPTGKVDLVEVRVIMRELLEAINYIGQQGIVHRDLKPENILVETNTLTNSKVIKVADFGLSCCIGEKDIKPAGTSGYFPPEVLNQADNKKPLRISSKIDVFSLGCLFYEL